MTVVGKIKVEADITQEMVDDYLVTAFEGGINYWCRKIEVVNGDYKGAAYGHEVISRGGAIDVYSFDEPFGDWEEQTDCALDSLTFRLSLDNMLSGIERACDHYGKTPESLYDYHDVEVADVIVQYALFGKVVFG